MKKIIALTVACIALCLASSCTKVHDEGVFFSPSSVNISVDQSAYVTYEVYTAGGGYGVVQFFADDTVISVENAGEGCLKVTGLKEGSTILKGQLQTDPSISGTCNIQVNK